MILYAFQVLNRARRQSGVRRGPALKTQSSNPHLVAIAQRVPETQGTKPRVGSSLRVHQKKVCPLSLRILVGRTLLDRLGVRIMETTSMRSRLSDAN